MKIEIRGDSILNAIVDEGSIELLPFYVYELRDPRDNVVFYVGKGKGNRIDAHNADEENRKARKIGEIEGAGIDVLRIIVARFETEAEALAVESVLIKWTYGFNNLHNIVHGHRHRFVRPMQQRIGPSYLEIAGIDRPRVIAGARTGEFTAEQLRKISENAVYEKLESLRDALRERPEFAGYIIGDPDLSVPQDSCIMVSGFEPLSVQLQIKMQLSGASVVLNFIPLGRESCAAFEAALVNIADPFEIKGGNRFGSYTQTHDFVTSQGGYPRGIPHENIDEIVRLTVETINRLAQF